MNESVGVLLFLLVLAAGLIAVIVAIVKSGDGEAKGPVEEKREPVLRTSISKEKEAPKPSQTTICSYRAFERKNLCPCCDGENSVTATACRICGQLLKKEGV